MAPRDAEANAPVLDLRQVGRMRIPTGFIELRRILVFDRAAGKCEHCHGPLDTVTEIDCFLGECSSAAESWALCRGCTSAKKIEPLEIWIDRFVAHCVHAALSGDAPAAYTKAINGATALLAQIQHQAGIL